MSKIKVKHSSGYKLADGGRVDYYDVGDWSMELIDRRRSYKKEIKEAKHAIKAHRAWLKWLKKQK